MQRISIPYLVDAIMSLEVLNTLQPGHRNTLIYALFNARYVLDTILNQSVFKQNIRTSRNQGNNLINLLDGQLSNPHEDRTIDQFTLAAISSSYQSFRMVFLAELGVFPSYFVTQKAGYDTETLLELGSSIFPSELQLKVPECIIDANEAGKALAFELFTACGFHTFRVVESVLRRYYQSKSGEKDLPEPKRSIGGILSSMKKEEIGDPFVMAALQQIKDLHRNPLAHPQVSLNSEEAISLIGMAHSVITFMLKDISAPITTEVSELAKMFQGVSETSL